MAERTRLFPSEGELGKVLGSEANLALRQARKNTNLEWFGPPERNTLHPLEEVFISAVYEPILSRVLAFSPA